MPASSIAPRTARERRRARSRSPTCSRRRPGRRRRPRARSRAAAPRRAPCPSRSGSSPSARTSMRCSPARRDCPPRRVNAWRTSWVVRFRLSVSRLDEHRDAAGSVPLVGDLLVARAAFGSPVPRLIARSMLSHGTESVTCLLDRRREGHVALHAPAALAGCDLDRPQELGEQVAALRVRRALLPLDRRPLRMPGHVTPSRGGTRAAASPRRARGGRTRAPGSPARGRPARPRGGRVHGRRCRCRARSARG